MPLQPKQQEDFLREFYKSHVSEMCWRRETEFKLLQYMLIFLPVLTVAMVELYKASNVTRDIYWTITYYTIGFIIISALAIDIKICHEHVIYKRLGSHLQNIYFFYSLYNFDAYLPSPIIPNSEIRKKIGSGIGYMITISIISIMAISVCILLIVLAQNKG